MLDARTSASLVPVQMSTRSCPASTMDATIGQPSGHRLPRRIRPDTVPSTRHASRTGSDADRGTDERHRRQSDNLDRHDHEGGPPGHVEPPAVGPALAAWQTKAGSAM